MIETTTGKAELRLHQPAPREVSLTFHEPWEGNNSEWVVVFKDDGLFRMYYTGSDQSIGGGKCKALHRNTCIAESRDGIHWTKPDLGLVEFDGSKKNNIILSHLEISNTFAPFLDTNPDCKPDEKYKALASGRGGLIALKSADGIHWSLLSEKPVITKARKSIATFKLRLLARASTSIRSAASSIPPSARAARLTST